MMGWNKILVQKPHENIISDLGMLKVRGELHARIFQAGEKKKKRAIGRMTEIHKTMK